MDDRHLSTSQPVTIIHMHIMMLEGEEAGGLDYVHCQNYFRKFVSHKNRRFSNFVNKVGIFVVLEIYHGFVKMRGTVDWTGQIHYHSTNTRRKAQGSSKFHL